jgi:lambda family phage portal protein
MASSSTRAAPSLLDRAIGAVSPRWALNRLRDRTAMALASGGYFGGSRRGRVALSNWNPGVADADGDISPDLVDLRAYSRDLSRTSALAGGAINTVVTNVVGTGLAMQPTPDADFLGLTEAQAKEWTAAVAREWKLWCESTDCDITRTQNFYALQGLAFRSALESGDVFAIPTMAGAGRPYKLALQLIEADRICNPSNNADKPNLVAGVELAASGAPVAYHISDVHPGARSRTAAKWTRVAAFGERSGRRNVLHLFDRRRPGQSRGVPYLASVIEPLKQLTRYSEAEISAAVVSAAFAVFVKMDHEAFSGLFDDTSATDYLNSATNARWDGTVGQASLSGPGKAVNLLPGESIEAPQLGRPNSEFDPFVTSILRQVGVGLELPFEVLVKHFTASYSAARAALLDAWRFFRGRRDWLQTVLCQPVYELWLEEAVALGRISAPGFFADPQYRRAWCAAVWTGDGPGSIDPMKEVGAAKERIAQGISTIAAESILHDGIDWETKHRQRVRENEARNAAGLNEGQAAPPPEPDADDEDDLPPARGASPGTPPRPGQPRQDANRNAGRQARDLVAALPHALDEVLQSRHAALLAVMEARGDALSAQVSAELAAAQAAGQGAATQQPSFVVNVAAAEAPTVNLEAVHHHHIAVAGAEAAYTQIDVHVPPAAAPVVNLEAVLPAPDVKVEWPTRETVTTVQRDSSGEMTGSTAIEKSVEP